MMKILCSAFVAGVVAEGSENQWDWDKMTSSHTVSGKEFGTFAHFDNNYMAMLMGTGGQDFKALHQQKNMGHVGLTSMEKVTAMTSVSTRANIRKQLVDLLKAQVKIESMYNSKKEKLYVSASATYNFIAKLLHNACSIALSNDALWKEQMQCFNAYKQLLEVYSMWNGVRDVVFALEHGIPVSEQSFAVCGPGANLQDHFVAHESKSGRLQNQYLVSATMRACYDNLQVRIEALRRWLSGLLVSTDSDSDRAQSCLFKVITVLTCLSSGNQENVLDLAIKEEHNQHVVYGLAQYASTVLGTDGVKGNNRVQQAGEQGDEEEMPERPTSFVETHAHEIPTANDMPLREARPMR